MALCLFSYLGVETASVAAAKVRDPDRNVPEVRDDLRHARHGRRLPAVAGRRVRQRPSARSGGELGAVLPPRPTRWSAGHLGGYVVAACVIVSGLGALNGWTMICAEMPLPQPTTGSSPGCSVGCLTPASRRGHHPCRRSFATVAMAASFAGATGRDVFTALYVRHHRRDPVRLLGSGAESSGVADKRALNGRQVARHGHRRRRPRVLRAVHLCTRATPAPGTFGSGCRSSWPVSRSSSESRCTCGRRGT